MQLTHKLRLGKGVQSPRSYHKCPLLCLVMANSWIQDSCNNLAIEMEVALVGGSQYHLKVILLTVAPSLRVEVCKKIIHIGSSMYSLFCRQLIYVLLIYDCPDLNKQTTVYESDN